MADKKAIGITGIILTIIGIIGTIPSSLNDFVVGIGGFGVLAAVGIGLTIYGFSD